MSTNRLLTLVTAAALGTVLAACSMSPQIEEAPPEEVVEPPAPEVVLAEPVATHRFEIGADDDVIGQVQVVVIGEHDTLSDVARRFNLGYDEIVRANPGVDPWLPGVGREIVLPTQFVLPDAPREGVVINLAQLRVFYFPKAKKGEPRQVITHPIGIGKVGWETPVGTTKVTAKVKNPTWYPPASVRKEHREAGDPLPAKVPPGPDNPLGAHMMRLGWPSYLMHGTNKPYGVGLRSSHGCIRFYPEDIAELFDKIPIGAQVTVVNQPFVFGWRGADLYVQAFPIMEDDDREHPSGAEALLNAAISDDMWRRIREHGTQVDLDLVNALIADPRGVATPVSQPGLTVDAHVAAARRVENRVPHGANWDGHTELLVSAEEFEAMRDGVIVPQQESEAKDAEQRPSAASAPQKKKTAQTSGGGAPAGSR